MFRAVVLCLCVSSLWALPSATKHSKTFPQKFAGGRIINGEKAAEGQFPWQAGLLLVDYSGDVFFCGGAIISEEWILTAGHCVESIVSGQAITGTLFSNVGYMSKISEIVLHEDYNNKTLANDIGLVKLARPLIFGETTAAINLASEELGANVEVTVSGWGKTSDDSSYVSEDLQYVNMVTLPKSGCAEIYGEDVAGEGVVCAVSATSQVKSACGGDSGGPVVTNVDSDPVHVAVVSFISINGCEGNDPNGMTRTAYYRDWIKGKTGV